MNPKNFFKLNKYKIFIISYGVVFLFSNSLFAQYNLNYFIEKAYNNSPVIKNFVNLSQINDLQFKLDEAQNSAFQVSLTGNYLLAPYFNNNGNFITTNPGPRAVGYDINITNGGLYSAQINLSKNILNGSVINTLKEQRTVLDKNYQNKLKEQKHSLDKVVADQYINTLKSLMLFNLSEEIVSNLNDQLKITGSLVEKGNSKVQDYLLLKIELKTQQINLSEAWQNYKTGLLQLYSVCGIKDTQTVFLDSLDLRLNKNVLTKSNFLNQYYLDSLTTVSQQKIFETKYVPQINLFFNAGLNAIDLNSIQRKFGVSAGVNFALPIFDGGQRDFSRQQSYIVRQTIADYKNYFTSNLYTQRSNSHSRINTLKNNLNALNDQVNDYDKLLNISQKQLEQGNLSMIEYLTLLKNYIDLKKNKITAEINYQLEISNFNYWNW